MELVEICARSDKFNVLLVNRSTYVLLKIRTNIRNESYTMSSGQTSMKWWHQLRNKCDDTQKQIIKYSLNWTHKLSFLPPIGYGKMEKNVSYHTVKESQIVGRSAFLLEYPTYSINWVIELAMGLHCPIGNLHGICLMWYEFFSGPWNRTFNKSFFSICLFSIASNGLNHLFFSFAHFQPYVFGMNGRLYK